MFIHFESVNRHDCGLVLRFETTVAFLVDKLYDSRFVYIAFNSEDKKGIVLGFIKKKAISERKKARNGFSILLSSPYYYMKTNFYN